MFNIIVDDAIVNWYEKKYDHNTPANIDIHTHTRVSLILLMGVYDKVIERVCRCTVYIARAFF